MHSVKWNPIGDVLATPCARFEDAPVLAEYTTLIATNYWAGHLGCSVADFTKNTPTVICHSADLAGYRGLFAFFRDGAPVISVPADERRSLSAFVAKLSPDEFTSPTRFASLIQPLTSTVTGPAFVGYADNSTFRPVDGESRLLVRDDVGSVRALEAACSDAEWQHGGSIADDAPTYGIFDENRLVARAGYEIWGGCIAHISVITHPEFRGRGLGRSVVSAIARHGLTAGLVPQYRTLMSNVGSMRVADSVGFLRYGVSVAARFAKQSFESE